MVMNPSSPGGGGGGGGAITIADGSDITQGTTSDLAYTSGSGTILSVLKGIFSRLGGTLQATITGNVAVTGTFWQATQPISGTVATPKGNKTVSAASVGTTAPTPQLAANAARKSALFVNNGTTTIFGGGSGVTAGTGIPIAAGGSLADTTSVDAWYFICASGTNDLRIVEVA